MTRQKHSNPLKDPELPARFARLLAKHIIKLLMSDEQLVHEMNKFGGKGSGSLASIRRHRDGAGTAPTLRMIGLYQKALQIPDEEIDLLLDPDHATLIGMPGFHVINEHWKVLIDSFHHQSQLPHHIQAENKRAEAAIKENNYDKARVHLEIIREWTQDSYREHEKSFTYAAEEYARALANLGALAFTSLDFAEARVQFGKLLKLANLQTEHLASYRHSYLVASNALAAISNSETEARDILAEMKANGVTPNVVSYSTLLNFVNSETEARDILAEMKANGVTPNVVSYNSLLNFVNSETEARDILAEMKANGVTPNVVSYNSLLNFVNSETEARDILAEMKANGVTPNVVSYSTLLNFVNSEKRRPATSSPR